MVLEAAWYEVSLDIILVTVLGIGRRIRLQ